ncbi:NEDD4 family-interacting protein 2 [Sitophilus oryzae]|uniref:NEDD4 family-interacting protein 2 n=2 Tax=Cucujiformia TaxID=41088 RepID=A0A6J2YV65_SITOR|nr:NEDD4 family-interacting protein 2 [Sitophilus oryzae]
MGTTSPDPQHNIIHENEVSLESQPPPVVISTIVESPGVSGPIEVTHQVLATSSSLEDIPPPKPDYYAPPPYEVATQTSKLPTYEEVQREKNLEDELLGLPVVNAPNISPQFRAQGQRIVIDNEAAEDVDTSLLGTDFMFYIAFFVAFIFNWIGFLLLMCFCHTIASRYGALSGFGLSLAKWTFIVQHSTELASKDNSWLWWLIMTFGLIICIRAILQYLSIKRGWHMLSASHQERLLFFY